MHTASALGLLLAMVGCGAQQRPTSRAAPPRNELTLEAANPVLTVTIAGQPLRLLVDPAQSDAIEIDPDVAPRLPVSWIKGRDLEIGRVRLEGRTAQTTLTIDGRSMPVLVSSHGRALGEAVEGLIGPDMLPYAAIHWRRPNAPIATGTRTVPMTLDPGLGLVGHDPGLPLPIRLRFSFLRPDSEATAAAGSFLVQRFGGRFEGIARERLVFLGVTRPERMLALDRAAMIAGFRFDRLSVRISDFRGANPLPADPGQSDEIVVTRRELPQAAQSWVTIARDRLERCAEVTYKAQPRSLTLSCAFD